MHVEILLAVLVLAVAFLVAVDLLRRSSDSPHEHAERLLHDVEREPVSVPRAAALFPEPVRVGQPVRAGPAFDAGPPGPQGPQGPLDPARPPGPLAPDDPPAGARPHPDPGVAAPRPDSLGARKSLRVGTRLALLAIVAAATAVLVTAGVVRAAAALGSASFHSDISSVRDGAVVAALVVGLFAAAVLAAGLWSVIILMRSVLRPLHRLRTGAVELAEVRLPQALRYAGQGRPFDVKAIGLSSSDEIGETGRALDQVQREALRLAVNDAGLRERLDEMFVDLSRRSQTLLERQARLIGDLEQGERDSGRLAELLKMDHIAARMRRSSQNLLVLAGRELPGRLSQPVALADVIRAAVSEIEDYERVSFSAQPGLAVAGPAVNDVVHLIAELTENATALSAADTPVDISGRMLASGGVLIDITDQGVGMNPDQMAQANWRLENPSADDITMSRSMGFFVVGRLAAQHGARVRLQPASSGGLTALVWLPDAIVAAQAPGGPAGPGVPGTAAGPGVPGTAAGPGVPGGAAGPGVPGGADGVRSAMAPMSAPTLQDIAVTAGQRRIPAPVAEAGRRPGHSRPAGAPRSILRARPSGPDQRPAPAQPPAATGVSAAAANPPEAAGPSPEDPAEPRRLPIYEAVESDWFRSQRQAPGGTAAAEDGWAPVADAGWHAADAVIAPSSDGETTAGLPVRVPRANLIPGAIGSPRPATPATSPQSSQFPRSASAARDRLAGFQWGTSQGRAAASGCAEDEA